MSMKFKFFILLLLSITYSTATFSQQILQEVIVDYQPLKSKTKVVKVELPKQTKAVFYRVTTFENDKVNTTETLYNSLRVINPEKLTAANYDFSSHLLVANTDAKVAVTFFNDKTMRASCKEIENTSSSAGSITCIGEEIYVAIRPLDKKNTAKLEIVALSERPEDPVNDRYPFTIQNEMSGEIAYEISGDRTNWQAFFLPPQRKAEFKLADSQVYLRVSSADKSSEEYKIDSGKKYRFFLNKDKNRLDLGEIPASK